MNLLAYYHAPFGVLFIVLLLLVLLLPTWPYSRGFGYYPSGGAGLVLVILIVFLLVGCQNPPTPEQVQAYSAAVHEGAQDYKDIKRVTR